MSKPIAITLRQFQERFPTDELCLDHLMRTRFGIEHDCDKCGRMAKFHRVTNRRSYACHWCGHQVFPTAGTPFENTRTPLRDWYFVMFMFCTTRNGVAAKKVERDLGVTYKTAWRMCHKIREYMASLDSDDPLGGPGSIVAIDETLIGGSVSSMGSGYKGNKTTVVGMLERGGELVTTVVTSRHRGPMTDLIQSQILPARPFGPMSSAAIAISTHAALTIRRSAMGRDLCITLAKRGAVKPLPFRGGVGVGNVGQNVR